MLSGYCSSCLIINLALCRGKIGSKMLLTLLAEERAKDGQPPNSQSLAALFAEMFMIAELDIEVNRLPDLGRRHDPR
jgi:hypothetical protein